jgi:hypothetical protein
MASPNVSELVTTTLKNRPGELADNVLRHIPGLNFMRERGQAEAVSGGTVLEQELEYAENSTFKYYSGYEALDVSASDVFTSATYDWKQAAVMVVMSGLEQRINMGKERIIPLVDRRIRNAEKTMRNNLSTGFYSDGTGTASKQIGGLQLIIDATPATGTVGSINAATWTFWRNVATTPGATLTSSNILSSMNTTWLSLCRGGDKPNMILADTNHFNLFWQSQQTIQRITEPQTGASGYSSLTYYGPGGSAPVVYDEDCPTQKMYFLNTDYLFWKYHPDANMNPLMRRESFNQDASGVPIIFMGNITCSNRSLQGVLLDA